MRAVQLTSLDGPESVRVRRVAQPEAGDKVLIDVHAAGVTFPEVLMSRGRYQVKPELPYVMGGELSGTVRSAPADSGLRPGDRVAALPGLGALAEVAAVPAEFVVRLPDEISLDAGAGLLFNDLTVQFALEHRGRLAEGETVLVHGAAGGVGCATLRLAKALGAGRVIGVVSTEEKGRVALAAGADDVVLTDDWAARARALTGGAGVDVVLDPVGGDRFTDSLRLLRPGGRCLVVGFTEGSIPTVKVNRLLLNNIDVVGVGWGAYFLSHPGYFQRQWQRLEPLYRAGRIAAPQVSTFPVAEVGAVLSRIEARELVGKAVAVF
jgi:NADPH2:quinone reductase